MLYADIIRYSNAPTNVPPWEVVKLLNDIHNMYDSLLEKHGLIKIRRSGTCGAACGCVFRCCGLLGGWKRLPALHAPCPLA